ncbi:hypothetical protein L596_008528 [Steinernema carpocapsae]|uniref:Ubiquitin-like domain-containing protein n=1 Tax=Steinernema carpocapsae TaxID=34508 RepID=A0A4U5PD19_STECR|nr:hypothetical protein L596_008528 [Steinernema carpocapsae]
MSNDATRLKPQPPGKQDHEKSPSTKSDHEKHFTESRLTRHALRRTNSSASGESTANPASLRTAKGVGSQDSVVRKAKEPEPEPSYDASSPGQNSAPNSAPRTETKPRISVVSIAGPPLASISATAVGRSSVKSSRALKPKLSDVAIRPRLIRTMPQAEIPRHELLEVTVSTIMAGSKDFKILMQKTATVKTLKTGIKSKTHVRSFILMFEGMELMPDDSLITSHGITDGATIQLQVKPKAGTSDREDIAHLMRSSQSFTDLRNIIMSLPAILALPAPPISKSTPSEADVETYQVDKEHENAKTRAKMNELRGKIKKQNKDSQPSANQNSKRKKPERMRRPRSPGTLAVSPRTFTRTTSPMDSSSIESSSMASSMASSSDDPEDLKTMPVTDKKLQLYFDLPEPCEKPAKSQSEMVEPPESCQKLEKPKIGTAQTRCGMCRVRIPVSMREVRCKCSKIFCMKHRNPQDHKCAVDFKQIGRLKLSKEMIKSRSKEGPKSKD